VEREPVPDTRVYFTPQRPATLVPSAPAAQPVTRKPAAAAVAQPKAAAAPSVAPAVLPAVEAPLAEPSVSAPAEPVPGSDAGVASDAKSGARSGPYEVGEVEVPAAPLSKAGPEYPEWAIRNAMSGAVTARFIVGANGRVESEIVILDSTSPEFTSAVRNFLRRTRYRPARVGGQPVRQLVEQRFVFALRS
jgi:protein TonB